MLPRRRTILLTIALGLASIAGLIASHGRRAVAELPAVPPNGEARTPTRVKYDPAVEMASVRHPLIHESSGLAISRATPGLIWTHNDSGDRPRLYGVDRSGVTQAIVNPHGFNVTHHDWEDMASFALDGKPWLVIGDIGDNARKRPFVTLYFIPERPVQIVETPAPPTGSPRPASRPGLKEERWPIAARMDIAYDTGPRDAEALAVDPVRRQLVLVTKAYTHEKESYVFVAPLPELEFIEPGKELAAAGSGPTSSRPGPLEASPIRLERAATLTVQNVTAMDIAPDGSRAVLATYLTGLEVLRRSDQTWAQAFAAVPGLLLLPLRKQGETIAYDADGRTLLLGSEGRDSPIWRMPAAADP